MLFLAVGLKRHDPKAAVEVDPRRDRRVRSIPGRGDLPNPFRGRHVAAALALVERVDPELVPEVFWRAIAARPPIGDPRKAMDYPSLRMVPFLARYDREVAAALFRPVRAELERIDDPGTNDSSEFIAWSLIDPLCRGSPPDGHRLEPQARRQLQHDIHRHGPVPGSLRRGAMELDLAEDRRPGRRDVRS